ncbi:hypothetical protein D4764_08G0007360 [Takifugu flavidus]|uniref:Uncharacterized protein n=1 Tax=Takifugu flavidus TaxID=433684 RepID=A0A5C6MPR2_9TELE|nr:hypothetical protein D4764_08G0007360 [Takifugu flavidus]
MDLLPNFSIETWTLLTLVLTLIIVRNPAKEFPETGNLTLHHPPPPPPPTPTPTTPPTGASEDRGGHREQGRPSRRHEAGAALQETRSRSGPPGCREQGRPSRRQSSRSGPPGDTEQQERSSRRHRAARAVLQETQSRSTQRGRRTDSLETTRHTDKTNSTTTQHKQNTLAQGQNLGGRFAALNGMVKNTS